MEMIMDVFFNISNINVMIGIGIFLMVVMLNMMLWFISITNDKLKVTNELLREMSDKLNSGN
jgi:hypothetical protein